MKRLLIIIMLFISIGAQSQNIIDHLGKIRMRYNNAGSNDTLLIQFSGDSTYYFSNTNRFHKFKSGLVADSLKLNGGGGWIKTLIPSQWTTSGSNIYYNTGNVGINNASPVYKLDVGGLIGGTNIETIESNEFTKLGFDAGYSATSGNYSNTYIGAIAGYYNETGDNNTFLGAASGYKSVGNYNTFIGSGSGGSKENVNNNTFLGFNSGALSATGDNNVFLGYYSGYRETGSNKLFIDNQDRIDETTARTSALIYGIFHATPASQEVHLNSKVYATHLTSATKGNTLYYDTSTKEISYGATPSGSSTILYSNNVDQVTSGTSETTLYNYDIDGGALLNNGDMIELYIVLVNGNPASTSLVDFLIDTTPVTLFTDLEGNSIVRIIINRVSSTSIKYFISYSYEQGATFGGYMTVTSASSINLTIKATASVSTITGQLFYVKNI